MQILKGNIYIGTSIGEVVPTYLGEINRLDDAILELTLLSDDELPIKDAQYYVVFRRLDLKTIRQVCETTDGIKVRVKFPSSVLLKADTYEGQLIILYTNEDGYTTGRVSSNIFSFKVNKLLED